MKCSMCGKELPGEALTPAGEPLWKMGKMRFCSEACKDGKKSDISETMKARHAAGTIEKKSEKPEQKTESAMPDSMRISEFIGKAFRYRLDKDGNWHMTNNETSIDCKLPKESMRETVSELSYLLEVLKDDPASR